MLENNEKHFFFIESTSERYFLPAVLNFYKTLCTFYTHKQANSQKAKRGLPVYDLDENKCLFIRSM